MDERDHAKEFKEKLRDDIRDFRDNLKRDIGEQSLRGVNRPKVMLVGDLHWGFVWGLVLALGGTGLLLHHLGIISFDPVARFWPLLLVICGVMNLLTQSGRVFGLLCILAGTFLQLNRLGITNLSFADLWPVALIAVGLLLMWGSLETRGFLRAKAKAVQDFREQVLGADGGPQTINAVAVFGGCERRVSMKNFEGGRATVVFGGIELDLRDADIETEALLEINCVCGGVEIRVPETWHVHSRSLPVFGGYDDKSRQPSNPAGTKTKTLIVTGMIVFGGVEIKN